jgi:hypothetical protein
LRMDDPFASCLYADDAWRFNGHSEDCLIFMSNAQSLVFLLVV